ncbi:MAG: tetratricopeptide repeat protein [bacterium]|nr:tetratricopeptide repeat protein [bacterium]
MKNKIPLIALLVLLVHPLFSQTYLEKKEFSRVLELYNKKDFRNAYRLLKSYQAKNPSGFYQPDVYFYLGLLEEDYYLAVIMYKELISKYPEYPRADEALYRLAKLYFLHSNYTEAVRYFEKLQMDHAKSSFAYGTRYYLGLIHLIKGKHDKAMLFFDQVITPGKKDKFHILALIGKANSCYEKQDYRTSIALLKQAAEQKNPNHLPAVYLGLGNNYMKIKTYDKAYYYYKKILKEYPGSSEYEPAQQKIEYMKEKNTILDKINLDKTSGEKTGPQKKESSFYFIQVASVQDKRLANELRIKLKTEGYDPFLQEVRTEKGLFYRTCVGRFTGREEAEKIKKDIDYKFKLDTVVLKQDQDILKQD